MVLKAEDNNSNLVFYNFLSDSIGDHVTFLYSSKATFDLTTLFYSLNRFNRNMRINIGIAHFFFTSHIHR